MKLVVVYRNTLKREIHILALGSSSHADQATLIPECLTELEGLTVEITSSSGIQIVETAFFSRETGLLQNLRSQWQVVPAIVTDFQASPMQSIVSRDLWRGFKR